MAALRRTVLPPSELSAESSIEMPPAARNKASMFTCATSRTPVSTLAVTPVSIVPTYDPSHAMKVMMTTPTPIVSILDAR